MLQGRTRSAVAALQRHVRFWVRGLPACAGFGLALAFCIFRMLLGRHRSLSRDTARVIARLTCPPLGITVRAGHVHRLQHQPCIYVANHQSFLDYPIIGSVFPDDTVIVGRDSMRAIPVVGWLFSRAGHVLLPREQPDRAHAVLDALLPRIRAGTSVLVFPEGTRGPGNGQLLPFRRGAFRLAIAAGVPVVPIVVAPLKPSWDLRARVITPAVVRLDVLPPLPTDGLTADDVPALRAEVQQRMQAALDQSARPTQPSSRSHSHAAPS